MRNIIVSAILLAASAVSAAAPATAESVEALLEATRTRSLLDQTYAHMEQMIQQGMAQALQGKRLNEQQRRAVELAPARIAEVMRQEMNWDKLRPIYVAIYRETFDQAEIDALSAFYDSPVGRSFVEKMPAVMQRGMSVMQVQMQSLAPKLKQAMDDVLREARLLPKT